MFDLGERENRVIDVVKAKYGLKNKSQALSVIIKYYEECELEPQRRPELVREIEGTIKKGKFLKLRILRKNTDTKAIAYTTWKA